MEQRISSVLSEIEKKAESLRLPIVGPIKGKLLADIVEHYKPRNVLEIGTLVGYSSLLMSQHLPKDGKIVTIELSKRSAETAQDNLEKAGVKNVTVIVGDALEAIPMLKGKFDMVFIDAEKEDYLKYLKACEPKLRKEAIIVADNVGVFGDSMRDFTSYVQSHESYSCSIYDFGFDSMEMCMRTA